MQLIFYGTFLFFRKIAKAAKVITIILLISILHVTAQVTPQTVTLSGVNMPMKQVFAAITKQTGNLFFYDSAILKDAKPVTINIKKLSLAAALDEIFKNQPFTWSVEDKSITVVKNSGPVERQPAEPKGKTSGRRYSGSVTSDDGVPIPSVTIYNKSTKKSAISKNDGSFEIEAENNHLLEFSSVGYTPREVRVQTSEGNINVRLSNSTSSLDQVVVIGYGNMKRKDLTGSISSVSAAEIKNVPFTSIDQALSGKASGVQVVQSDGSPGGVAKIRIRGGASLIGGNDPLYIIDGVPVTVKNNYIKNSAEITNPTEEYSGQAGSYNNSISGSFGRGLNNLAGLNINDIESIDILKDASATAIYGSKAANGVVIITTKKGSYNTKPIFELNNYTGFSTPLKEKVLNAEQYKSLMIEGAKTLNAEAARVGQPPVAIATQMINNPNFFGNYNTDWLGLVLRNGFSQNTDISVKGGGSGSKYYTSLGYTQQTGTLIGSDFKRLSGKINLDNDISAKLKILTNLDWGYSVNNITSGIYSQAMYAPPTESPYNADGTFSNPGLIAGYVPTYQNPLAVASGINRAKSLSLLGTLAVEYDILKSLKFRSAASINYFDYKQQNYVPSYVLIGVGDVASDSSNGGTGTQASSGSSNIFFENTLTWTKEFNKDNRLNFLVGTSWESYKSSYFSATGSGYPDDKFLNNLNSAAVPVSVKGSDPFSKNALLSFYVRANYTLMDKYLFTFTGRSDASSKFAPSQRVGYFPSGAVAWRISEEPFLKNVSWIDEIKVRASAGLTGTQNIGDNLWRTLFTPVAYAGTNGLIPSQLGNEMVKWESTIQKDLGLDYAFFDSRIVGTVGLYEKITDGLLLNVPIATSSSYANVLLNLAKIRNRGLEIDFRADVIRNKEFKWTSAINFSKNVSKVLNINGAAFSNPNKRGNEVNLGTSIVKEGEPLGLLYGYKVKGIIKTQQELDAYKAAVNPFYMQSFNSYLNIGDIEYELDPETNLPIMGIIGHSNPKFTGGFTNTFNYKNFSLISQLTYSYGNQLLYQNDVNSLALSSTSNRGTRILDHYSAENPNSDRPRLVFYNDAKLSSLSVFDASYLKLKSISIAYNLPKKLTDRLKIHNASIYVSGTNLFTITHYPGLDPEVSDDPSSIIGGGRDMSTYPTIRSYVAGVRVGF